TTPTPVPSAGPRTVPRRASDTFDHSASIQGASAISVRRNLIPVPGSAGNKRKRTGTPAWRVTPSAKTSRASVRRVGITSWPAGARRPGFRNDRPQTRPRTNRQQAPEPEDACQWRETARQPAVASAGSSARFALAAVAPRERVAEAGLRELLPLPADSASPRAVSPT